MGDDRRGLLGRQDARRLLTLGAHRDAHTGAWVDREFPVPLSDPEGDSKRRQRLARVLRGPFGGNAVDQPLHVDHVRIAPG